MHHHGEQNPSLSGSTYHLVVLPNVLRYDHLTIIRYVLYYVAAPSYKRAHIDMHYIFNADNGNWIPTILLLLFQP
jgi:hypothetical protein